MPGILPEGRKSRAGMRLYRGTITEDPGCLMARWRPTIVTSRLGRGGGGDQKGGLEKDAETRREVSEARRNDKGRKERDG